MSAHETHRTLRRGWSVKREHTPNSSTKFIAQSNFVDYTSTTVGYRPSRVHAHCRCFLALVVRDAVLGVLVAALLRVLGAGVGSSSSVGDESSGDPLFDMADRRVEWRVARDGVFESSLAARGLRVERFGAVDAVGGGGGGGASGSTQQQNAERRDEFPSASVVGHNDLESLAVSVNEMNWAK